MRHAGAGDKEREIWKGSHPWEHPEGVHTTNMGLQELLPAVELQLGRARLFLAVEKGLRQQEKNPRSQPATANVGMGRIGSVVSAVFHSPDPVPRLGTHRDTRVHVRDVVPGTTRCAEVTLPFLWEIEP